MLIIDKGNFLVIPVYHKEWKKIIQIKGYRFNPEIHEHLSQDPITEKPRPITITSEDIQRLDEQIKENNVVEVKPLEQEVKEVIPTLKVEIEAVAPVKKRGMPKGGWPKKEVKKVSKK